MLKRTALLAVAVCLAWLCVAPAQSQQSPPQVEVKQPEAPAIQPKAAEDQRGTDQSPLIVKIAPTPKTDEERAEEAKQREEKAEADRRKEKSDADLNAYTAKLTGFTERLYIATAILAAATVLLVLATIGLLWFAGRQARDMKASIEEARRSADAAKNAAGAADLNARATIKAQRAYVKMSHLPPGITFSFIESFVKCQIEVKNYGQTPARINDVVINLRTFPKGTPFPDNPQYDAVKRPPTPKAFLVAQDSYVISASQLISEAEKDLKLGNSELCVFGYVDYVDEFGQRHRGGYGRKYVNDTNNLVYVENEGYNYDRLRQPGEGNDWDDAPQS
jgi:hypothetical protein